MRLMGIALVVAIALIVDQLRTGGYYRDRTVGAVQFGVFSVLRVFS